MGIHALIHGPAICVICSDELQTCSCGYADDLAEDKAIKMLFQPPELRESLRARIAFKGLLPVAPIRIGVLGNENDVVRCKHHKVLS